MSYQCKKPVAEITLYILKHWKILKILIKIRIAVNKGRDAFHCWVASSLLITYSTIHIAQTFSFWKITHNTKIIFPSWFTLLLIFHIFQFESFLLFHRWLEKERFHLPEPSTQSPMYPLILPKLHLYQDPVSNFFQYCYIYMCNAVFSWSSVHKPTYCLLNSDVHETPLNASFSALANFHLVPSPLPQ